MRLIAASTAAIMLVAIPSATGSPGDIFSIAAPASGADAPKAANLADGETSVATKTGAFQYNYPVNVPPGRNGMQPHLALHYSSQGAIFGGIAAGWSLDIPMISLDTSVSRLAGKVYMSTMAGGMQLIPVKEPVGTDTIQSFRAQGDTTFTRYELYNKGDQWRARGTDGKTYYFGDADHVGTCASLVNDRYAPLTREVDPFGNVVEYFYELGYPGECRIKNITWGQNATAGVSSFASVTFAYLDPKLDPPCAGYQVGALTSYRTGTKLVTGASRLDQISITAYPPGSPQTPDHTRTLALTYSADDYGCTALHGAYRSLISIQETASGTDSPSVSLPAVKFSYGNASFGTGTLAYPTETHVGQLWNADPTGVGFSWANLGWGWRFNSASGKWPTVEAMMIDIDGDGLQDRVVNAPVMDPTGTKIVSCGAKWERNLGGMHHFGPMQDIPLPTLKWATPDKYSLPISPAPLDPYHGGDYANQGNEQNAVEYPNADEGCSLNYQQTDYINSYDPGGAHPCPIGTTDTGLGYCTNGDDTVEVFRDSTTILAYRWMDVDGDGLIDIVASPVRGGLATYNLQRGNGIQSAYGFTVPQEPPFLGTYAGPPTHGSGGFGDSYACQQFAGANPNPNLAAYRMCGARYPWFVYKNHGNGVFGLDPQGYSRRPDTVLYQAMPLESSTGDSSLYSQPVGNTQGMLDFDGDGFVDGVYANPPNYTAWNVCTSTSRSGGLMSAPVTWPAGSNENLNATRIVNFTTPVQTEGVLDLTGDGLPDHWSGSGTSVSVEVNDGAKFLTSSPITMNQRPGADGTSYVDSQVQNFIIRGYRTDTRRTMDVDVDGRVDVVANGTSSATAWFNQGGQYGTAVGSLGDFEAMKHWIVASDVSGSYTWELRSDMTDLDGDGIAEGVNFGSAYANPGLTEVSKLDLQKHPPRLMVSVDNGRGDLTDIAYAHSAPGSTAVTHTDPAKPMPRTEWVVESVTSTDQFAGTVTTTGYSYVNPRWVPDDRGRYGFRGFDEVDTTLPTGAKTIERFSYDPDWSGRIATTLVVPAPAEGATDVREIDDTTWKQFTLFDGAVETYHATVNDHWTCSNGLTESACRSSTAGRTSTVSTWTALESTTSTDKTPLLWAVTQSTLQAGQQLADGDRTTSTDFALNSDGTNYHLVAKSVSKYSASNGSALAQLYAETDTGWDSTYRVPQTTSVWVDTSAAKALVELRDYDMTTGNLLVHKKPVQYDAHGPKTSYAYDSRKLFVAATVNELNQEVDYTYEYGTGVKLKTTGPNVASCAPSCTPGTLPKEEHRIRVDGIGRTIERYEAFSTDGTGYTPYLVESFSYVDSAVGTTPTSSTHQLAYDINKFAKDTTTLDGHGRPLRRTVFTFGTAPNDAVTQYHFSNVGTLAAEDLPDPTQNSSALVTYSYTYDSLGRPIQMRRPDASGYDIAYDGLVATTTEALGGHGGQAAQSRGTKDRFGRLVQVEEETVGGSSPTYAATQYDYAPDNNVEEITNPDGVVTKLTHDFAGRRTSIERFGSNGSRLWVYGYDKNGNVVTEQTPCAGAACAASITTTFYDDLDRPISKLLAPRSMSAPDLALFGADHEKYIYDTGTQGTSGSYVGRMTNWLAYGPSTPAVEIDPLYNAQGQTRTLSATFNAAGYSNLTRQTIRDYYISQAPSVTQYEDYVGGTTGYTTSQVLFDSRGLPSALQLVRQNSGGSQTIAVQTRDVAGFVTSRHTDVVGSPMTYVESVWTYDQLGRVIDQTVQKGPGPVAVAEQHLGYFGNDDPSTLDQYLGSSHHQFQYQFDLRHQLANVAADTQGYFSAQYGYTAGGRLASVNEAGTGAAGGAIAARNVTYVYKAADPEEVSELDANSTSYASYRYDDAGNEILRCNGSINQSGVCDGESVAYLYDGKDQLRRATKYDNNGGVMGSEEYWYDLGGNRIAEVKYDKSGAKTELLWWMTDTEAHYDASGAVTHVYSYLSLGTPVARVDRTSSTNATVEFQFHGLANSTLAAVDQASGTVNASFSYAPFGELVEATDAGGASGAGIAAHRRRMNDKYHDEISGLVYYGARYYDPVSMTWTQGDPLRRFLPDMTATSPRRSNLYTFDVNNPLRYVDPDGQDIFMNGNNRDKAVEIATALQGILGKNGERGSIQMSHDNGRYTFKVNQTDDQKKHSTRSSQDLAKIANTNSKHVQIFDVTKGMAKSDAEKKDDAAGRALTDKKGGAGTAKTTSNSYVVVMDFKDFKSKVDSTQRGDCVPENAASVLGHEVLGHAGIDEGGDWDQDGSHSREKKAREYENKNLREEGQRETDDNLTNAQNTKCAQ